MIEKIKLPTEVLNCDYFNRTRGFNCYKGKNCNEVPDCYYKQLKRKEQECKDLREDIKDIANLLDLDTCEEYSFGNIELEIKQLKAKEQEREELKKQVKELRQGWVNCDKERNIQEANSEFNQRVINRYKQTFTEIKEIVLKMLNYLVLPSPREIRCEMRKILQKISECERKYEN